MVATTSAVDNGASIGGKRHGEEKKKNGDWLMECEEKDLISQWWKWHYEKNDIA
jgi:hypothetical protein